MPEPDIRPSLVIIYSLVKSITVQLCLIMNSLLQHACHIFFCWKWPAVPLPRYLLTRPVTQLLLGVWPSYLSPRSAGCLDNTCYCLSRYTRAWTLCRPCAVIVRQGLSLYGAHDSELGNCTDIINGRQPYVRRTYRPQTDADWWGRRSGRFRTTRRFVTTCRFTATGWFETTWQFRSTRSPHYLSVDTAAESSE